MSTNKPIEIKSENKKLKSTYVFNLITDDDHDNTKNSNSFDILIDKIPDITINPSQDHDNYEYDFVTLVAGLCNMKLQDLLQKRNDKAYIFAPILFAQFHQIYTGNLIGGKFIDEAKFNKYYVILGHEYTMKGIHSLLTSDPFIRECLAHVFAFNIQFTRRKNMITYKETKIKVNANNNEENIVWKNLLFSIHKYANLLSDPLIVANKWNHIKPSIIHCENMNKVNLHGKAMPIKNNYKV